MSWSSTIKVRTFLGMGMLLTPGFGMCSGEIGVGAVIVMFIAIRLNFLALGRSLRIAL
jgi:hypothetical protein